MKTRVIIVILAVGCFCATGAKIEAAPEARLVNTTINFGRVTQHKTLATDFWLKSIGDDTLKIEILWPGCGCTEIPLSDSSIAPGDSLALRVQFDTRKFHGPIIKTPNLRTNASDDLIKMSILAEVYREDEESWPFSLRPYILDVSQYSEKSRRMGKFHLENMGDEDFRVRVIDSVLKGFEIKISNKLEAGDTIEGRIRVRDEYLEKDFDESITLELVGQERHRITLPIRRRYRPLP